MKRSVYITCITFILALTALPSRAALAPDFILPEADGNTFALNRQKGKVVLLSFWASYCKPCIAEMPLLENLWATYRDSGLAVAGISIDTKRSQAKAKEIAVKQRVSYPILYDLGQKAMTLYKVKDVPATFLIDKRGNIRYHCEGFTEKTKEELIDKIKLLLAELKAPPVIYFAGIECKGKAAGLKQQADSLLLAGIPEKYKKITFETGSPGEADYCLSGAMVQMGQVIGIDLALKSNLKDEKPLAQVAATGQVAEALDKLKGLVNEILSNIK